MPDVRRTWYEILYTYIWIFNTSRGLSVCIRLPHNVGIIYDLGRSEEFSPAEFISKHIAPRLAPYGIHENTRCRIAQCVLCHPHADHIQEIEAVLNKQTGFQGLYPFLLTCPHSKDSTPNEAVDFSRIAGPDNQDLIRRYQEAYAKRNPPLQTIQRIVPCNVPNVEYGIYYMRPPEVGRIHPKDDHLYGNGLSLVLYLRHGNHTLLIPGDITPEVMREVLRGSNAVERRYTYFTNSPSGLPEDLYERTSQQPTLSNLLQKGLSISVTAHHGLTSCFSTDLHKLIKGNKPQLNVISEKTHLSDTEGQVDARYQCEDGATGLSVDIDGAISRQFSVSTRNDHHILIIFQGTTPSPRVYLRRNPEELLNIV